MSFGALDACFSSRVFEGAGFVHPSQDFADGGVHDFVGRYWRKAEDIAILESC